MISKPDWVQGWAWALRDLQRSIRWAIARIVGRHRSTCWADVVMWAICPELHPFSELWELFGTRGQCERRGELPYCGKCQQR